MGHDTPDWGGYYTDAQTYPLLDQAELAARLGAPTLFDRRGAMLWFETFEHGIDHLNVIEQGTGSEVKLVNHPVYLAPFGVNFYTGTTADSYSGIVPRFDVPSSNRIAVALLFKPAPLTQALYVQIIRYYTWGILVAQIVYDNQAHTLAIRLQGNVSQIIASGLSDYDTIGNFVHLKLVADFDAKTYIRTILSGVEYDLSDYDLDQGVYVQAPSLAISVYHRSSLLAVADLWIDDVIVTSNEP